MSSLSQQIASLARQAELLLADPQKAQQNTMPGNSYFLQDGQVLALPRDSGDSRYPYGQNGFNFWAYASGYMHCNEGLFSHFLRSSEGQEPKIAFFAAFQGKSAGRTVVPLLSVPKPLAPEPNQPQNYSVLTATAAYYFTLCPPIHFGLRVLVTLNKEICFSLHMENVTNAKQAFDVSSFLNPYLRNQIYESGEDRWFKEISALPPTAVQDNLGSFLILVNEDLDRHTSITNAGVIQRRFTAGPASRLLRHEETTSRNQYVGGARSSLHTPAALLAGTFDQPQPVCTFVENAIAADLLHVELGPGDSARLDIVFSNPPSAAAAHELAKQPIDPAHIDQQHADLETIETKNRRGLRLAVSQSSDDRLKPQVFNHFFEHLKKQVEFCSLIKGYIQLSANSLIGIRDVFQAIEGYLFWQPQAAKQKMLEALGFTCPNGRCFRQYSLPSSTGEIGRADLRPFIDQGVWVISTVATYLRVTGDRKFLDEICSYHDILDEVARKTAPAKLRDSVLDHLIKILDYLLSNRDPKTRCVLALYGDWNDAIDGLGISKDPAKQYGTGVSVMATLQTYQNLHEVIEILQGIDASKYADRINAYKKAASEIEQGLKQFAVVSNPAGQKRILHGWGDEYSYFVGSFKDPDGKPRDGLTSNAFWVLSGLYEKDPAPIQPIILDALNRLDSKYGYKTFEPFFPPDTPGVGRIGKLPPGTAENGASYVHASVFAIMALFKMGRVKEAWEQIVKVLPFTAIHENLSHSPFVMPNSYGYNPDKFIDGQNMNDWQTGSSNVMLKLLIRYVFGFEPASTGLWIQPAAWSPFKSFQFDVHFRSRDLIIKFSDQGRNARSFSVNGQPHKPTHDPVMNLDKLFLPYDSLPSLPNQPIEILVSQ